MAKFTSQEQVSIANFSLTSLDIGFSILAYSGKLHIDSRLIDSTKIFGTFSTGKELDYAYGNYTILGSFTSTQYLATQFRFSFPSVLTGVPKSLVLDGNVNINLNTKVSTGSINHAKVTLFTGDSLDVYGYQTTDSHVFAATSIKMRESDGSSLWIKGNFRFADNFLPAGNVSVIKYRGLDGYEFTISGLKVKFADLHSLTNLETAISSLMSGNDVAIGTSKSENLRGFFGNDSLYGGAGKDILLGNEGNDTLNGGTGNDTLVGGLGNDTYLINLNALDQVQEEADGGNDTYQIISNNPVKNLPITLNIANYNNIENFKVTGKGLFNLIGDSLNNKLIGNQSANKIEGGIGSDTLIGGGGADTLFGGSGDDIYVMDSLDTCIEEQDGGNDTCVLTTNNSLNNKPIVLDLLSFPNIEAFRVIGKGLFDLIGNSLDNSLIGNISANHIIGGDGNDTLDGGGGNDTLEGGEGNDIFKFEANLYSLNFVLDTISDFNSGIDSIYINHYIGYLSQGKLSASSFVVGSASTDLDDRIVYDNTNGKLYFDSDGSGDNFMVQFATLSGAPTLTASDIFIV